MDYRLFYGVAVSAMTFRNIVMFIVSDLLELRFVLQSLFPYSAQLTIK